MKKNYYGNIEDIVQNIKVVTPIVNAFCLSRPQRVKAKKTLLAGNI